MSADSASVQRALDFVRASRLRGGTDLQRHWKRAAGSAQHGRGGAYLILLSDGGATRGPIQNGKLASWYAKPRGNRFPPAQRPRTYILGVGDDANLPLLQMLARKDGVLEHVLSTEPVEFKLNSFLSKIGRSPIGQLSLDVSPDTAVDSRLSVAGFHFLGFHGGSWVGRFQKPQGRT